MRDQATRQQSCFTGSTIDVNILGLFIRIDDAVLPDIDRGFIEIALPAPYCSSKARMKITWRDDGKYHYGIGFVDSPDNLLTNWQEFLKSPRLEILDRRDQSGKRRFKKISDTDHLPHHVRRENLRRVTDIWDAELDDPRILSSTQKKDLLPRLKKMADGRDASRALCEWVSAKTGAVLNHIPLFSEDPKNVQNNIEYFIGMAQVPIGIAGPLKIKGQYADGDFYVPMATTEPTLVYTYTAGMRLLSSAGGVNTMILKDEMHLSPVFRFDGITSAKKFVQWLSGNFDKIKEKAESVTRHGKLKRLEPHIFDRNVVVKFCYTTGDAAGFNMITIATNVACQFIRAIIKPETFYLQSNFSSIKKITAHNLVAGYGKMAIADVIIPRTSIQRFYGISPESLVAYSQFVYLSSAHAGMVGVNGHSANALAALFIACGQDVASVVESHTCITNFELTKSGDLYVSVKLPNLIVGTVGGGTGIGTQKECLEILHCYGHGKAKKFAEISAATVLAGEVGIYSALVAEKFSDAHKKYRRRTNSESTAPSQSRDKVEPQEVY
jgi:hydroxymethylglutaryl-CoA reductase (NADPH)